MDDLEVPFVSLLPDAAIALGLGLLDAALRGWRRYRKVRQWRRYHPDESTPGSHNM